MSNKNIEKARQVLMNKGKRRGKYLNPIDQLKQNPNSRKKAINAFCYECMGMESYIEEIRNCTALKCPLYKFRPYKNKGEK